MPYLNIMLPQIIATDLFNNYQRRIGEMTVGYLTEELLTLGYCVTDVRDYDMAIVFDLSSSAAYGMLRIDRIYKEFEITVIINGLTVLPCRGTWHDVIEYLTTINAHLQQPVLL